MKENFFTRVVIPITVPILSAILSALLVWFLRSDWETSARSKGWISLPEWEAKARENGWIVKDQCPAYPVKLQITSPGHNSNVELDNYRYRVLDTAFVVTASKSIPLENYLGLIFHKDGDPNYYVKFPNFEVKENRRIFRHRYESMNIPFDVVGGEKLSIWALLVSDKQSLGEHYSTIDQIELYTGDAIISDPIIINIKSK